MGMQRHSEYPIQPKQNTTGNIAFCSLLYKLGLIAFIFIFPSKVFAVKLL